MASYYYVSISLPKLISRNDTFSNINGRIVYLQNLVIRSQQSLLKPARHKHLHLENI
uniref:Uncharacterized protein n=1 Tax=Arundo donax TaxID=35708 RepID=A0A0A8Z6Y5_ARUDO